MIVAVLLAAPIPPFAEPILPVVLFCTPATAPVTVTTIVQVPLDGTVPPLKLMTFGAVVVRVPPHTELVPVATVNPAGSVSVNPTPVNATVVFGLAIINVNEVVVFSGIVTAPNAFEIVAGATTVIEAVLLKAPVPVSVALIAPVVLFFTPAVTPATVTLKLQVPPAATVAPASETVLGAVVVNVPPPHVVAVPLATVNPAGSVSVKLTPVIPSVAFVLVIVNVNVVVEPSGIVAAPNAFEIVGGVATVTVAVLLVVPVPPFADVTAPVVLFFTPPVAPVTVTLMVQVPPAATAPPVSATVLGAVVVRVPPPHVEEVPVAIVKPGGKVSVNATPVSPTVELGFVMVKLRLVVPLSGIFGAPNALLIVGGASTVIVAVLLAEPVPPLVELTAPAVLFFTPAVAPVTVTVTTQLLLDEIEPPASEIVPGAVVVKVPPPHVLEVPLTTVKPAGSVSVNPTPLRVVVVFGLVIVSVRTLVPLSGIVTASNDFVIVAGPITVSVAVLLVLPAPVSVELIAPVVLFHTPVVDPVTVTEIVQVALAARLPPDSEIVPGAVVVSVPPPHVA
ncbi:MAG TPA: hypothetical protein VJX67_22305 [Blastocatellia bacterium]|nr:hypothetical protein [Blastocatellia bacterium]